MKEQIDLAKRLKEETKRADRLETIVYSMASYLTELYGNSEDNSFRHHKLIFGITKEEYNKYFKQGW